MNKELEALKFVKDLPHENGGVVGDYAVAKWETIETALKDYEHLQETRYVILGGRCSGKNYKADILLKLKALEIIKEKKVDVYGLCLVKNLEEYNKRFSSNIYLEQTEYDLLKEVLL